MPAASRITDLDTGHPTAPPRPVISSCAKTKISGLLAARMGDTMDVHGVPPHPGTISGGSSKVTIEGKAAARVGDAISCGGTLATGSPKVNIGG